MKPEPGWYPDPTTQGQLRWWDGDAWTAQTRSAQGATPAAAPASPAQSQSNAGQTSETPSSQTYSNPAQSSQSQSHPGESNQSGSAGGPSLIKPTESSASDSSYGSSPSYGSASSSGPSGQEAPGQSYGSSSPSYGSPSYGQAEQSTYGQGQAPSYGQANTPSYGQSSTPGYGQAAGYGAAGGAAAGGGYSSISPYPSGPGGSMAGSLPLAGQGYRLLARIIDGLLVGAIILALTFPLLRNYLDVVATSSNPSMTPEYWTFVGAATFLQVIVLLAYEGTMLYKKGATLGKMAVGIKVQSQAGGNLSLGQAMGRVLTMTLPNMVPCLGTIWGLLDPLWCLWDPRRECLHDKIVKSTVVTGR